MCVLCCLRTTLLREELAMDDLIRAAERNEAGTTTSSIDNERCGGRSAGELGYMAVR